MRSSGTHQTGYCENDRPGLRRKYVGLRRHHDCQHREKRFMSQYPLTNVHPDAKIGSNVVIEPFATVKSDVVIGDNCWIGANVVLWEGTRLGTDPAIITDH